jgi:hypothetical protein
VEDGLAMVDKIIHFGIEYYIDGHYRIKLVCKSVKTGVINTKVLDKITCPSCAAWVREHILGEAKQDANRQ